MRRIKFESANERITKSIGLFITNEFIKKSKLEALVDKEFGKPGSNRGFKASLYISTLISMFHDGATRLEDVNHLQADEAYQELLELSGLPTSDAIGDWLRRQGDAAGEKKILTVMQELFRKVIDEDNVTLDIDATIIESDKGDAEKSYKGIYGYHPLLGWIAESGLFVGSEFRQGNISPQADLWNFIKQCEAIYGKAIRIVRSDSAGFKKEVIENCMQTGKCFTVTADHSTSIIAAVKAIPEECWQQGVEKDGVKAEWDVAETVYTLSAKKRSFRLVVKRLPLGRQMDLFVDYKYWIVATNLPVEEYPSNAVILFHHSRGQMEKAIGELKHQFGLEHLPCGQFGANALYFTIGILAYNILQLIKSVALPPEDRRKNVRTIRYQLIHLAARLIFHARYVILRVAAPKGNIELLQNAFLRLRFAPS